MAASNSRARAKKSPFETTIKVKGIHLSSKPQLGETEERFEPERAVAAVNETI